MTENPVDSNPPLSSILEETKLTCYCMFFFFGLCCKSSKIYEDKLSVRISNCTRESFIENFRFRNLLKVKGNISRLSSSFNFIKYFQLCSMDLNCL